MATQPTGFKKDKFAPFFDLINVLEVKEDIKLIDLGCGTGEITSKLLHFLPNCQILGIDSDAEILMQAEMFSQEQLLFANRTIQEQLLLPEKFDLIFSYAAIQWVGNHKELFPTIISKLNDNGQIAFQIPNNQDHITHKILEEISVSDEFSLATNAFKRPNEVLSLTEYAQIFYENSAKRIQLFEKVYPVIFNNVEHLLNWAKQTILLPYLQQIEAAEKKAAFIQVYSKQLQEIYVNDTIFYPFKRIILSAQF